MSTNPLSRHDEEIIPVGILTGFLGSGKTTLLQHWLKGGKPGDTAVLINEFGDAGLDHLLIGEIDQDTVLLENGCVCCSIRGELKTALLDMLSRRQRGQLPPFRRIVVETTGLATPGPVLATLLGDIQLRQHLRLAFVTTVVDATRALHQYGHHGEWLPQVAAADTLWMSKTDLVPEDDARALGTFLQSLNPLAAMQAGFGQASDWLEASCSRPFNDDMGRWMSRVRSGTLLPPGIALRNTMPPATCARKETEGDLPERVDSPWRTDQGTSQPEAPDSKAAGHAGTTSSPASTEKPAPAVASEASSFCLEFDQPLDWFTLTIWLTALIHAHGQKILRIKGLLWIRTEETLPPQVTVLHGLGHLMHPPEHLTKWPDPQNPRSRLVFITQGLDQDTLKASWQAFERFDAHD